jgi:hypothetical protein
MYAIAGGREQYNKTCKVMGFVLSYALSSLQRIFLKLLGKKNCSPASKIVFILILYLVIISFINPFKS